MSRQLMASELARRIRPVLVKAAPHADAALLDQISKAIALRFLFIRLAPKPSRGTAPALKRLEDANRKLAALLQCLEKLGTDEKKALRDPFNIEKAGDETKQNPALVTAPTLQKFWE